MPDHTASESMFSTVRVCAPPSADQPKSTHARICRAHEVVSGMRSMKHRKVWCFPGQGTTGQSRVTLTPVTSTSVGSFENSDLGSRASLDREKQSRARLDRRNEKKLSRIVESQEEFKPGRNLNNTVNASNRNLTDFSAVKCTAQKNEKEINSSSGCTSGIFSDPDQTHTTVVFTPFVLLPRIIFLILLTLCFLLNAYACATENAQII